MENTKQSHIKVLIVEDEIDICYLLTGIIRKRNLSTTCVSTLHAAEEAINGQNPDILFIDNHLPDGFGVNFISQVKKNHPSTKIVMITAYDTNLDKEKALHEGADFFIGKPFTGETINNTLDAIRRDINN